MARQPVSSKRATSPRGRPTPERAAAIDEAIRAAALEQFLAAGYEAASMDAIAAAARVSKGTLYARFKGKEPLFRSIVIEQFQRLDIRASSQNHLMPTAFEPRLRHHARMLIQVFGWSEYRGIMKLVESATGSSTRIVRAVLLDTPLSIDRGEVTDKGSINQRAVLENRSALIEEIYSPSPPAQVITLR